MSVYKDNATGKWRVIYRYRKSTRVAKLINTAGFPQQHSFTSFDPSEVQFPASVTVESLKALDFYHAGNNLVMYGSTGTGKTMLSICIGMEACRKGIPVKFFRTAALINQLSEAQEHGTLSQIHKRMDKAEIIILDEFGYVPYNRTGSQLLFDYLSEIHEGLRQDIFNNTSRCFEGEPAYDLYVNWMCGGVDPQQEDSLTDRMHRLANGTDETSITYL